MASSFDGQSLASVLEMAANLATTLGVVGVFVAYLQFREGARSQEQAKAVAAWQGYLQLALQYPNLSLPADGKAGLAGGSSELTQYKWFVSALLFAAEQVLEAHPKDPGWRSIVAAQLSLHRGYLTRKSFPEGYYSSAVHDILDQVMRERPLPTRTGEPKPSVGPTGS